MAGVAAEIMDAPTVWPASDALNAAMDRYAAGDDRAFAAVYDALAPRLYGFLVRRTNDGAMAEDLVQQTFLQIHRARGSYMQGADVVPWAFAIARRLLIDGFRRRRREVLGGATDATLENERSSAEPLADDALQAQQAAQRFEGELAALPEAQRVAFQLLKQEGLSLVQAAQTLGTTVAAVKLRAHRAYEALRGALRDDPAATKRKKSV